MAGLSGIFGGSGGGLLVTGETVQMLGELDDGYYQKGTARSLTVLTTGQYAGTVDVDLVHLTAATIAFVAATKLITDTGNGLAVFKNGDTIVVSGSVANDGVYTVAVGNVAGQIEVAEALIDEGAGAAVAIAKRGSMSNECVKDNVTGLMFVRGLWPSTFGNDGNGALRWSVAEYEIFACVEAMNAAAVGGYSDWRVANLFETLSVMIYRSNNGGAAPDTTAFPGWNIGVSCSTSGAANNGQQYRMNGTDGGVVPVAKADRFHCLVVRG